VSASTDCVGIVGAGPFGTALAAVVARTGGEALLWSRDASVVESINRDHRNPARSGDLQLPAQVHATEAPGDLGKRCRFIVLAVAIRLLFWLCWTILSRVPQGKLYRT